MHSIKMNTKSKREKMQGRILAKSFVLMSSGMYTRMKKVHFERSIYIGYVYGFSLDITTYYIYKYLPN